MIIDVTKWRRKELYKLIHSFNRQRKKRRKKTGKKKEKKKAEKTHAKSNNNKNTTTTTAANKQTKTEEEEEARKLCQTENCVGKMQMTPWIFGGFVCFLGDAEKGYKVGPGVGEAASFMGTVQSFQRVRTEIAVRSQYRPRSPEGRRWSCHTSDDDEMSVCLKSLCSAATKYTVFFMFFRLKIA